MKLRRFFLPVAGAVVLPLALLASPTMAAASGSDALVRLAHLSPDTPYVDVYVATFQSTQQTKAFVSVPYKAVSDYTKLAPGTYTFAMRPAGSAPTVKPVLQASTTVKAGGAYTVAGVGPFSSIGVKVLVDDLRPPAAGRAKIRFFQATTDLPTADIAITGTSWAVHGVASQTATGYTEVSPGTLSIAVTAAGSGSFSGSVPVKAGSVMTVALIGGAGKAHEVWPILDAAGASVSPSGGVATGGGGTAPAPRSAVPGLVGIGALTVAAGLLLRRRRAAS